MNRILITGGTVFVSRYSAAYFVKKGWEVYVLNRGTHKQEDGVHLICADRNDLGDVLRSYHFDAIIDICAYCKDDIHHLLDALDDVPDYIMISSSAVYPQNNVQPFMEEQQTGDNAIWGSYGTDKIAAEEYLLSRAPQAYILRPPYLYGPMQNVYREPFIFECALKNRPFYIPHDGSMTLQFFHVEDLCRLMEVILMKHPEDHIMNVGNESSVTIETYVELCYEAADRALEKRYVHNDIDQRSYFPFYDYAYELDVTKQKKLLPDTKDLLEGLRESFAWYIEHTDDVKQKDYIKFISQTFE